MINIGIILEDDKDVEGGLKFAKSLDSSIYNICIFSDMLIVGDFVCFSTSEVLYFRGILLSFTIMGLSKQQHMRNIDKMIWITPSKSLEQNQVIKLMDLKKDKRFMVLFDEDTSIDIEEEAKDVYRKSNIKPQRFSNKEQSSHFCKNINTILGEL
jgi:hypothetical protein